VSNVWTKEDKLNWSWGRKGYYDPNEGSKDTYESVKPYQHLGETVMERAEAPSRFLKTSLSKESELEKPYQADGYTEMHQDAVDDNVAEPREPIELHCIESPDCDWESYCVIHADAGVADVVVVAKEGELLDYFWTADEAGVVTLLVFPVPEIETHVFEITATDNDGNTVTKDIALACSLGYTFTGILSLQQSGGSFVIDSADKYHVLSFKAGGGGSVSDIVISTLDGSWSWDTVYDYSATADYQTRSMLLAVDGNNDLHAVYAQTWTDSAPDPDEYNERIRYATDSGGSWSSINIETMVNTAGYIFWTPHDIFVDSNGYVHMVYSKTVGPWPGTWTLRYATNATGSWVKEELVAIHAAGANIAEHSGGDIIIVYSDATNDKLIKLKGSAGSWSSSDLESNIPVSLAGPLHMVLDSNDVVHTMWVCGRKSYYYYQDTSGELILTDSQNRYSTHFNIVVDSVDTITICYLDYFVDEGTSVVQIKVKKSGGSWSDDLYITTSYYNTIYDLAVASDDEVHYFLNDAIANKEYLGTVTQGG